MTDLEKYLELNNLEIVFQEIKNTFGHDGSCRNLIIAEKQINENDYHIYSITEDKMSYDFVVNSQTFKIKSLDEDLSKSFEIAIKDFIYDFDYREIVRARDLNFIVMLYDEHLEQKDKENNLSDL